MNARYAKNLWTTVFLSMAISSALNTSTAQASVNASAEGRVLVKFESTVSEQKVSEVLKRNMGREIGRIPRIGVRLVEIPKQFEEDIARQLAQDPNVVHAQTDARRGASDLTPNDAYYGYAWHLPKIGAPSAWDYTLGAGVVVAVVDSGVDESHPDLAARMVPGWNLVSDNDDTADVFGHGTSVAGVIAAETDNAIGAAGLTWDSGLMPVRITNSSTGVANSSDIAEGIIWAAEHGARVINVSYAMSHLSVISDAAAYARSLGAVVIMPAGNDGYVAGITDNPDVMVVSATDTSDLVPSWSTRGNHLDLAAPGQSIVTTTRGGGYTAATGTSFAAPIVAGVAALVAAANPDLSAQEIEDILESSADDFGPAGWDIDYGAGRINAAAAVQLALSWSPAPVDMQAPSVAIDSPAAGSLIDGLVSVQISASDDLGVTEVTLYANGALIGSAAEAPYAFDLDTTAYDNGALELVAYAYDAAGNETMADVANLTIDNYVAPVDVTAPTAQITYPTWNQRVRGTVTVKSIASDDVELASMTLYIDNAELCTGAGPVLNCSWNAQAESRGYHYVKLVATDTAGNSTSHEVRVKR